MLPVAAKRILAFLVWGASALYWGARLMLDFLGYTTAPEDFGAAQEKLPKVIDWLFSTPWWVPSLTMVLLTGLVIWVCLPREWTSTISAALPQQPAPNDYKIDPWVANGQRTYAKVKIDIDNWRVDAIEKENIYEVKVSFIGEGHKNIEMVVIFDRWVPNPGLKIDCDRKEEGYRTEKTVLDDRYAICRLFNIKVPCVIELGFD